MQDDTTAEIAEDFAADEAEEAQLTNETDSPSDDDGTDDSTAKPKRKSGFQKRVDELVREREDWKRQAQFFAEQARVREEKPKAKAAEAEPSGAPKSSDYDTYEAYIDALTDYKTTQALTKREQAIKVAHEQQQRQHSEQQRAAAMQKKISDGRAKYEDFDDVALSNSVPITPAMAEAIAESDIGADLAYFLGNNPSEAAKIASMSPASALRALGRIEAKLDSDGVEGKQRSNAPAPIKPVGRGAKAVVDPSKLSIDEWMAWRQKQVS